MKDKIRELLAEIGQLRDEARELNEAAETEKRDFTEDEQKRWNAIMDEKEGEIAKLEARLERAKLIEESEPSGYSADPMKPQAPAHVRKLGDNFNRAMGAYLRDGDDSGLRHLRTSSGEIEIRASNDTDMNIGTAADGGNAVPTGFYNQIIARRDEMGLTAALGVRMIPGVGTTVNVPVDNEDDGEFITKAEAAAFDRDAPALDTVAFTLVKYTKRIQISDELMQDEDARLMDFLADFVARGQAKTMNNLLLTEVASNGTALDTFAAAAAIASGEPENIVYNDALGAYLDDSGSVGWVMRPATYGAIASITGNPRVYAETPAGSRRPELLGYPVFYSNKAAAIASTAITVYFGNWNFVGYRESPGFTMLRDPYSSASTGQTNLWMYFRTVFKVLQAEAIGYGKQAT